MNLFDVYLDFVYVRFLCFLYTGDLNKFNVIIVILYGHYINLQLHDNE